MELKEFQAPAGFLQDLFLKVWSSGFKHVSPQRPPDRTDLLRSLDSLV